MVQSPHGSACEQIIDTMIQLTQLSYAQRVIVAGNESLQTYLALHRRGYFRVTTMTIGHPHGQYAVGYINGEHSCQALETNLDLIARFLGPCADIAIRIDHGEAGLGGHVRERLETLGFRIEAGVRCKQGLVLSAHRQNFSHMANAA
jgi:hypothetical protein